MPRLEVFDPPLCCPTGVCGPRGDPVLPRFAAQLAWRLDFAATNLHQEARFQTVTSGRPS